MGRTKVNLYLQSHAQVGGLARLELRRHHGNKAEDETRPLTVAQAKAMRAMHKAGDRKGFVAQLATFWPGLTVTECDRFFDTLTTIDMVWG